MHLFRTLRPTALALSVAISMLGASACDRSTPSSSLAPDESDPTLRLHSSLSETDEGRALSTIAELTARSLTHDGLRQAVKQLMRNSPFREHKLEFRSYLQGPQGGPLLGAMAREYDGPTADILALLDRVRPLELYMPVDEHRLTWTGTPDVVVAALIEDHTIPAGYTVEGDFYEFSSAEGAPDVPVLSLAPVETDFSRVPDRSGFTTRDERQGEAIGVWTPVSISASEYCIKECYDDPGGGGSGFNWADMPTGLYMTAAYIPDDHEGFGKGDPEFETHLQSPLNDPSVAEDRWCAAESDAANALSIYDHNNRTWTGVVMVSDSATQEEFRNEFGTNDIGQAMVNWEDDDTRCEIKADENRFQNMIKAIAAAYDPVTSLIQDPLDPSNIAALRLAKDAVFAMASWLKSNDDVVGSWIEQSCEMPNGITGNWTIKDGTTTKGCVNIRAHDQSIY